MGHMVSVRLLNSAIDVQMSEAVPNNTLYTKTGKGLGLALRLPVARYSVEELGQPQDLQRKRRDYGVRMCFKYALSIMPWWPAHKYFHLVYKTVVFMGP